MIEVRMKLLLKVALGCSFLHSGGRTKKSRAVMASEGNASRGHYLLGTVPTCT